MLCEKCQKNQASTHIKTVVNGIAREYNLCSECAAKAGYNSFGTNSLAEMIFSVFGEAPKIAADTKRCKGCNSTFSDIAHSGKVGCAECYSTFKTELLPYIKRVHGAVRHTGKMPNSAPLIVVPKQNTVDDMRLELNRLVSEERYEEAAVLRDKIKKAQENENE